MKKIIEQIKILKTEQNTSDNNINDPGFPESQPNIDDLLDELLNKIINEEINFDMESIVRFLTSKGMVEENAKELAKSFMNEYNDIFGNNENQSDKDEDDNQKKAEGSENQSEEENDIDKELQKSKVIKSLVYLNDHIINKLLNDFEKQLEELKHYLEDIPQKKEPIMKSQNKSFYVDNNIKVKLLKALKENQINLYDYSLYIQKGILTDKAKLYINNNE